MLGNLRHEMTISLIYLQHQLTWGTIMHKRNSHVNIGESNPTPPLFLFLPQSFPMGNVATSLSLVC